MEKIKNILDKIIEKFCIAIMGIMTLLVTWQVITRYFFNNPSIVTEQTSQYLFVWLVMYGSAYVFGKREHMQISFIRDLASPSIRKIIDIIQEIIITIFVITVMIYGGYFTSLRQMGQLDAALQIPMGVVYSAIPISGIFIIFYAILNITKIAKRD
ncbi:MAG: TRAP transporter small permease [Fusobacterium perfoetens]|uniref:TRAP transporter small permease n=1 Tax=Fusobacterium perfoetens TaxID=852 RepID=UPI0023F234AB|nr:TRAP transporter small permease [Fusobacterium perfoetens]MCI6151756.1 TRAP transporter small permease [Fusobacterium perfoetens]MDY3236883.1 TRAP transporter small permease [Fusobacterium perfoetens]